MTLHGRFRWRWVGRKVLPFGLAHVGGRELSSFENLAVLPPGLLFLSNHATRPTNTFRSAHSPTLHAVATSRSGLASPPLCFGFLRFPSFFFRDGSTLLVLGAQTVGSSTAAVVWGPPHSSTHVCAVGPCLACFRVGGFAERRPPTSSRSLRWALTCTAFVMYLRLPQKKIYLFIRHFF